jgi:glucose/arabinose dehydrogenase
MLRKVFYTVVWVSLLLATTAADFTNLPSSEGQSRPAAPAEWPSLVLEQINLPGLASPVYLTHAGDGSGRMFIVERAGRIRLVKNGNLEATPFLDISSQVLSPANGGSGEDGMSNVAFPPDYAQRQRFYVYYTNLNGDIVLARFRTSSNPDLADPASKEEILVIPHPAYNNHNGGQLAFGPDGYLYLAPGDGGGRGDPNNNAQNPDTLLGKVLRIDVEGKIPYTPPSGLYQVYLPMVARNPGLAYSIPPDNPFVNQSGYRPEIWALGLRNPWRFSFDRQTQDLYIADVGQDAVEEVDFQAAGSSGGANYGWKILEGSQCFSPATGCVPPPGYVAPIHEYTHLENDPNICSSITGGYVYRGSGYPDLQGIYFFADFCTAKIWGLKFENSAWQTSLLLHEPGYQYTFSSFGEDEAGEVYLVRLSGQVYRLTGAFPSR